MEEFETSSRLGFGNGGVRAKFEDWNPKWRSSIQIITLGIGNGGVRANVRSLESEIEPLKLSSEAWKRDLKSSRQILGLELEMQEFEPSSDTWNRKRKSSRHVRSLELVMEEFEPSSKLGIGN